MKITFLGTGTSQGIPVIGSDHPVCLSTNEKDMRLRSSIMIEAGDTTLVIDCGPDFRTQMLNSNCTGFYNSAMGGMSTAQYISSIDE